MSLLGEQRNYPFSLPVAVNNQELYKPLVRLFQMYILGHIYQQFRAYSKLPFPYLQEGLYLATFLPMPWNNRTIVLELLLLFCLILFFVFVLISFFISVLSLHNITDKLTFHDTQRLHPLNALFSLFFRCTKFLRFGNWINKTS